MLFNSYIFVFLFLPVTFVVYFSLNKARHYTGGQLWLTAVSLFFYGYWNPVYLPIVIGSMLFNYFIGSQMHKRLSKKKILVCGIAANLILLGYFKYTDFFISNMNYFVGTQTALLNIILPLGISFFTFTQIAYLVETYRGKVRKHDLLSYSLFVTYFPHLLAGPIIHYENMMPQFLDEKLKAVDWENVAKGVFLFGIGLGKKVLIADQLAIWANAIFQADTANLTMLEAWIGSLSYTFQLYFDFSGYTDMALGISLMLNIKLPINFNSPYQAVSIIDFWRRWHMTLSSFLRDYLYIPLGGNRSGKMRHYVNLMITMLLGGLWHGSGWTFVFWGGGTRFSFIDQSLVS